jgi:hypothetical protein
MLTPSNSDFIPALALQTESRVLTTNVAPSVPFRVWVMRIISAPMTCTASLGRKSAMCVKWRSTSTPLVNMPYSDTKAATAGNVANTMKNVTDAAIAGRRARATS